MFYFHFFRTFAPIFHFKFCKFYDGGAQEYFLPEGARYPSYATGVRVTVRVRVRAGVSEFQPNVFSSKCSRSVTN